LFFAPKENLYYFAEEQLKPLGVTIAYEEVIDHGFSLEIKYANLYVQKIKSADIESAIFSIFGLYNTVSVSNVRLDKTFEPFFPLLIQRIDLRQNAITPLRIDADALGDFGKAEASINLLERTVDVLLKPSKLMRTRYKNTLSNLQKTKEGNYRYEYKF
ncbi:MAG: hypothetical protein MUP09_11055, partial [Thiovulaceae bacterium]|nr:hypothetical protein [Sulfurimonadaceae bacterium]